MNGDLGKQTSEILKGIPGGDFKKGLNKQDYYNEIHQKLHNKERAEEQEKLEEYKKSLQKEQAERRLESYKDQNRNSLLQRQDSREYLINQIIEKSNGRYTRNEQAKCCTNK